MTSTVDASRVAAPEVLCVAAPEVPYVAAPLRAVDYLSSERDGDVLTLTARVAVRGDDPNLRGHFPGLAVFPGIFIIEALTQAMAFVRPGGPSLQVRPPALRTVQSVRFIAPLLDGDELTLEITVKPCAGGWLAKARGLRADGTTAARITAEYDEFPDAPANGLGHDGEAS